MLCSKNSDYTFSSNNQFFDLLLSRLFAYLRIPLTSGMGYASLIEIRLVGFEIAASISEIHLQIIIRIKFRPELIAWEPKPY